MDFVPLLSFGLLLVRPGMVVTAAPPFNGVYVPAMVKIGLTVLLASVLLPFVPVPLPTSAQGMGLLVARESAIGLALGMAVRVLIAATELAGYLVGFQLGFSYAGIIDPQSGVRNNVIASLYSTMALLAFLAINGHHTVLRALATSFQTLPIGTGHIDPSMVGVVANMLGVIFGLGAQLAAPIVIVLLLVELSIGLISRTAPSLNLMAIGAPIRLAIGLVVLATAIETVPDAVSRATTVVFDLAARAAMVFR